MFKIEPIQDKSKQKELCELLGTDYCADYFGYYMYDLDSGKPMGFSQFEISDGHGYIKDLLSPKEEFDREAMFILGRQTMNFIDMCGAHLCFAADSAADPSLLSSIGFKRDGSGKLFCDMTGMFEGGCGNH